MEKIINKYKEDPNIINIYIFGSHIYGTNHKHSDIDLILVVKNRFEPDNIDTHIFTIEEFQRKLDNMDIQTLEAYFAPNEFKYETHTFTFNYNESALRKSISTIANNSLVKGKKKLIIMGDYDLNAGLKSVFHSIRILDYGIQIAKHKEIINFKTYNYVLEDLKVMSEFHNYEALWEKIESKYLATWKKLKSEFKTVCSHKSEKEEIAWLHSKLNKYDVPKDLMKEIYNYFK